MAMRVAMMAVTMLGMSAAVWADNGRPLVWPQPESFYQSKGSTPSQRRLEAPNVPVYAQVPGVAMPQPMYGQPVGYPPLAGSVPGPAGYVPAMPMAGAMPGWPAPAHGWGMPAYPLAPAFSPVAPMSVMPGMPGMGSGLPWSGGGVPGMGGGSPWTGMNPFNGFNGLPFSFSY